MRKLLTAARILAFALVLTAAGVAAWQLGPWAGGVVIGLFAAVWIDTVARCQLLRLDHVQDVELIDEQEMPRVQRLVLDLERRVRSLERGAGA